MTSDSSLRKDKYCYNIIITIISNISQKAKYTKDGDDQNE